MEPVTTTSQNTDAVMGGEPAAFLGLVVSVLSGVLAIITGQVTPLDGSTAIFVTVFAFVAPLVQAYATRRKVTPVSKSPQLDAR